MPTYHFDNPDDIARYLHSLPAVVDIKVNGQPVRVQYRKAHGEAVKQLIRDGTFSLTAARTGRADAEDFIVQVRESYRRLTGRGEEKEPGANE